MIDTRTLRIELPSLQKIRDANERFYLRMYLRSNMDKDQDEAQRRCAAWGVDYAQARAEVRAT